MPHDVIVAGEKKAISDEVGPSLRDGVLLRRPGTLKFMALKLTRPREPA